MTAPIRYRPHHFLCSLGFEGKGYSNAFTQNMAAIVQGQLRAAGGEDCMIEVTLSTDDICSPCPKRRGVLCRAQSKIARLDRAHARALELIPGEQLSWGEALSRIKAQVKPGDLAQLCRGCSWLKLGLCEDALTRLHDAPLQVALPDETPQ
ncbi:MAG: DUF1284 domain-containing protein [Pseudomonadota bacterium]